MISWPGLGTRVTVRYRLPAGSVPPLTDAVGHLLATDPVVRVRTKTGALVECAPADVVALRSLTDAPVRNSEIRALEWVAATARPGAEQTWLDGWLLRAGDGVDFAVPLDISASASAIPGIAAWYRERGLTPRLAVAERLVRLPPGLTSDRTQRILVRDVPDSPDAVAVDPPAAATPAAITDAPDGTRWLGLWAAQEVASCGAWLAWAARHGATRAYLESDGDASPSADALGFRLHHRRHYVTVVEADWDSV